MTRFKSTLKLFAALLLTAIASSALAANKPDQIVCSFYKNTSQLQEIASMYFAMSSPKSSHELNFKFNGEELSMIVHERKGSGLIRFFIQQYSGAGNYLSVNLQQPAAYKDAFEATPILSAVSGQLGSMCRVADEPWILQSFPNVVKVD